jgi:F1F0 ATPase subunit 2
MNPLLAELVWALAAGIGLGLFFYGGLWLTVRHLARTRHPARWWLVSFLARALLTAGGLLGIMGDDWRRLPAALIGLLTVRLLWTLAWAPAPVRQERKDPQWM